MQSFAAFQADALYGPDGFFTRSRVVGRSGSFLTSPSLGSVFARVLGNAIDSWWITLGKPPVFDFIECGGADGALAAAILQLDLRCRDAMRYTVVERSTHALEQLRLIDGVRVAREIPSCDVGVVFANELLDNLPVSLLEWDGAQWNEVCVDDADGSFVEVMVVTERNPPLDFEPAVGARVPMFDEGGSWLTNALGRLASGFVVCVDYTRTTAEMASLPQEEWLRTYREHQPGVSPLLAPGSQDITCDVAFDQLERVRPFSERSTQASFLERHGIGELQERAQKRWQAGAATGGIDGLLARAELTEIATLTNPMGLGAFDVVSWTVN